jgi:3-dehydrosphinganine reductase
MDTDQNKLVLITGGSSGIGLALAKNYARIGANVAILARRPEQLAKAAEEINMSRAGTSQWVETISADVSDYPQVSSALQSFTEAHGTPDLLINSAGIVAPGSFQDIPIEDFSKVIDVNYLGTVYATRALIPGMIARKSGHIVNISSVAGFIGVYGHTNYCASKFAVRGFTDVLRVEMKQYGIQVSIVYPPDTDTPQLEYEHQHAPAVTVAFNANSGRMSADAVAANIVKGISKKKKVITPGFEASMFYFLLNTIGYAVYPAIDLMTDKAIRDVNRAAGQSGE